jgi:ATP-dependent Clp protease ATP-binding subunit ClpC
LDIIDEACARKSTMSQKLANDDGYKKNESKIKKVDKEIEQAIDSQDYFKAAELKEKQEKLKKDMLNIRNSKNIPMHLRPEISKNDIGAVISEKL